MKTKYILILVMIVFASSCSNEPPKILIIGDSISLGYTPYVKEALGEKAVVSHNPGNAQHSGTGLEKIEEWIGDKEWDIIQFNWGLWDLCYRHDSSKVQGKRDKVNGTVTFTPDEYKANLEAIVSIIKESSRAKLLFVTTSYVPEGEAGRIVDDAILYNSIATEVMKAHKIRINEFYEFSKEVHKNHCTAPNNVHYTNEGYKELSFKVIEGLSVFNKRLNKNKE